MPFKQNTFLIPAFIWSYSALYILLSSNHWVKPSSKAFTFDGVSLSHPKVVLCCRSGTLPASLSDFTSSKLSIIVNFYWRKDSQPNRLECNPKTAATCLLVLYQWCRKFWRETSISKCIQTTRQGYVSWGNESRGKEGGACSWHTNQRAESIKPAADPVVTCSVD